MLDLWNRHREDISKTRPRFSKNSREVVKESFLRFKERTLKYYFPSKVLRSMTREEREMNFRRHYSGRKVKHFDHKIVGGSIRFNESYKIMPRGRLSDMKGKIRDEVREALLIKPSKTAKLVGTLPFPYGNAPASVKQMDKRFLDFIVKDELIKKKRLYKPEYNDRVSVSGNWSTQWRDFQDACDPVQHKTTYEDLLRALKIRGLNSHLKLPFIDTHITPMHVYGVETNPKAQTGLMSGRAFGRTHKIADDLIKPVAERVMRATQERTCYDTSIWSLGGRDRRQKLNEDKPLRSRIIMMPDGVPKIIGLTYASRIYDGLSKLNYGNPSNECQICRNDFHGQFYKYSDYFTSEKLGLNTLEADISKHDASTSEEQMVIAFCMLRACFPDCKKTDKTFLYMMSGTIFKNVAVPGRFIYRLSKSIPSGSPFTSILTTLVNWLNWSNILTKRYGVGSRDFRMNLFGDDTIVSMPDYCREDASWFYKQFKDVCGYELDPCEIKSFHNTDWRKRPSFLKSLPNYGLPARLSEDFIISASFTRRRNRGWLNYAQQATVLCYSAPFNFDGFDMCLRLRRYCKASCGSTIPRLDYAWINDPKQLNIKDATTYRVMCRNYLCPRIYGFELTKNVDLGNKPKKIQDSKYGYQRGVPRYIQDMFIYITR